MSETTWERWDAIFEKRDAYERELLQTYSDWLLGPGYQFVNEFGHVDTTEAIEQFLKEAKNANT